jgi:hypothetical protein
LVQTAPGEEIDNIHKKLVIGKFHVGNDGNFLTVGATFEQDFWWILRVAWGKKCHYILVHSIGYLAAIRLHHLVKNVVQ